MNQKEIKELIELLVEKDITEFQLERGDMKLHVKRGACAPSIVQMAPAVQSLPVTVAASAGGASSAPASSLAHVAAAAEPSAPAEASPDADLYILKSPIVGTYYEAPSPGTPPFVKVGDSVKEGQVLCIIEAMKLMNEIEAEVAGVVAKIFVANGGPVEYGLPLFGIRR